MSKRKVSAALLCTAAAVLAQYAIQAHQQPQTQQNRTGQAGLRLIVDYEGCRRNAYQCSADVWTNGVGNTHNVDKHKILNIEEIAADLRRNIHTAEQCVNQHFNGNQMTQGQFDAMTSLVFNVGCQGVKTYYSKAQGKRIPTTLYRAAQDKNWDVMCDRIGDFNKAGGNVLKGLQRRRTQEIALCKGK